MHRNCPWIRKFYLLSCVRLVKNFQQGFPLSVLFPALQSQPVPWQACCCFKITTLTEQWEELAVLFLSTRSSNPFDSAAPRDGERFRKPRVSLPGRRWGQWGVSSLLWALMAPGMQLLCPDLYPWESQWASSSSQPSFPQGNHSVLSSTELSLASWALHPSDLPSWPLQSCPKPRAQAAAFQFLQPCLLDLSPAVATGSEHLKHLQHKRLKLNFIFYFLSFAECSVPHTSSSQVLCPARLSWQYPASLAGSPSSGELLCLTKRWERMNKTHGLLLNPFCFLSLSSQHINAFEFILQSKGGKGLFVCLLLKHLTSN